MNRDYVVEWWVSKEDRQAYWHIIASNQEVIVHSEGYTTAWSCRRTARKIAEGMGVELRQK